MIKGSRVRAAGYLGTYLVPSRQTYSSSLLLLWLLKEHSWGRISASTAQHPRAVTERPCPGGLTISRFDKLSVLMTLFMARRKKSKPFECNESMWGNAGQHLILHPCMPGTSHSSISFSVASTWFHMPSNAFDALSSLSCCPSLSRRGEASNTHKAIPSPPACLSLYRPQLPCMLIYNPETSRTCSIRMDGIASFRGKRPCVGVHFAVEAWPDSQEGTGQWLTWPTEHLLPP